MNRDVMQTGCKKASDEAGYPFVSASSQQPSVLDPSAPAALAGSAAEGLGFGSRAAPRAPTLERVATWLSAACAVHCLVVPVASALVPLVGVSSDATALDARYEEWLHVLVVAGGLLSLLIGYRRHRELRIAGAMAFCIALYLAGHAVESAWYGVVVSVFGGLGLAAASFWSARRGHLHVEHCDH